MDQSRQQFTKNIGVLLHPTALPNSPVCGGFGESARTWLQSLAANGIGVWQFLPLSPPDSTGSPYSSPSGFALNPWFLDARDLLEEGFIPFSLSADIPGGIDETSSSLDFKMADKRSDFLGKALREFWSDQSDKRHLEFRDWCAKQFWLEDHAMFMELNRQFNGIPWWEWPKGLAMHKEVELQSWKLNNLEGLLEHRLLQWHLERQWQVIRNLARDLGVLLFGDLPFYVARNSADVWSKRSLFSILPGGDMEIQSGVPPDYFSSVGQLWGTPVYRWHCHRKTQFRWWRFRFLRQWEQVDLLRLDHFRALHSYWAVEGDKDTAEEGVWQMSPGADLLHMLRNDCKGDLPIIAEDLGIITPEVESLRDEFKLPGMKILQFAFDGDPKNPYLPENIIGDNWIVYTGTHDNATTNGWWKTLDDVVKSRVAKKLGESVDSPSWQLLEMGLSTDARIVMAPVQDLLCLDDGARFNTPGTIGCNWKWRLDSSNSSLENALRSYGERGSFWGRSSKFLEENL